MPSNLLTSITAFEIMVSDCQKQISRTEPPLDSSTINFHSSKFSTN